MSVSIWQLLIVLLLVLVLFGAGRLPQVMSDLGKGLKSFKDSMKDDKNDKDKKEKK